MDRAQAIETAAKAIEQRICRGFEPGIAAWAGHTLREVILPRTFDGWDEPDEESVREVIADGIAQFDDDSADDRYYRLALGHFQALLGPTADAAFELAQRALDGRQFPAEAAELAGEIHELIEAMDPSANPIVWDELSEDVAQALADCLFAAGERSQPSSRIQALLVNADERTAMAPVESGDVQLDRLGAQARAALAVSYEAALFATSQAVYDRQQVMGVRVVYEHALDLLGEMKERFGDDAVRRVSDDQIRADLITALQTVIEPEEWDSDASVRGMLFTRLSRPL